MGLFDRLRGKKPPAGPRVLPRPGELGQPNAGMAQPVGADDIDKFLYWQEKIFVTSSNVAALQYVREEERLIVWYNSGAVWAYDPISESLATLFLMSPSKGSAVWDHIKVRGTVHEHQVNAVQIA